MMNLNNILNLDYASFNVIYQSKRKIVSFESVAYPGNYLICNEEEEESVVKFNKLNKINEAIWHCEPVAAQIATSSESQEVLVEMFW